MILEMLKSVCPTPIRTGIRRARAYTQTGPLPWFKSRQVVQGRFASQCVVEALHRDGVCVLERYLTSEQVAAYRAALNDIVLSAPNQGDTPGAYLRRIDFRQHPVFARLALDELLLAAVEAYYARPIYLAFSQVQRLNPIEAYEARAFQWHHDAKGKYVKAMWLLTDVPATGQRMSYILGSHRTHRVFSTYRETRLTDGQARVSGSVFECAAPAGSVVIFDTNGIHRGNRNPGPIRELVLGVYSAGRYRLGNEFDLATLSWLSPWQAEILRRSKTGSPGMTSIGDA